MTTHVSLDFETLGLGDNAVLLALGACTFDPATGEIGAEFYAAIDPRTQPGRVISPDTVVWWLQQDEAARAKITEAVKLADTLEQGVPEDMPEEEVDNLYKNAAHSIQAVARGFIAWFDTLGDDVQVWANGAVDHAWMQSMMDYCGYKNPIKFWNQRDYRTLKGLFPTVECPALGQMHNALDDALRQAKHAVKLMQHLGELTIGPVEADDGQ
jgi:exodeoxyribonuclease VIII